MRKEFKNRIQEHVYSIPTLVCESIDAMITECEKTLDTLELASVKKIVITGCGYSYAAALTIRDYLCETVRLPMAVLPAIEVSRFSHGCSDDYIGTLLIAISNSGEVSRLNEAVQRYKQNGASVVALTANLQAPIATHSDYAIDISSPSIGSSLPLRGYAMTILALIGIGHCLAKKAGKTVSDANSLKASMKGLEQQMEVIDSAVIHYLEKNRQIEHFEFVGSGFERGTAFLGKFEMLGQAGTMALDEDAEQWCHCNFFMANPERIGSVLFYAKNSPSSSRTREVLEYMLHLKRPVCLVTDDSEVSVGENSIVVHLPEMDGMNAGLMEMTVPSFLTGHYCDYIGETYSRGFRDQWAMFKTGMGTCESEIVVAEKSTLS